MTSSPRIPLTPAEARQSHLESAFWRRTLLWGLRTFPPSVQRASMPLWAAFFYFQVPHVRRAIESNFERLCGLGTPRKQAAAFRTFTNYCRCIANAYLPYVGLEPELEVEVQGVTHLREVLRPDRGAVLATGHLGNWQLGPHYLARHGLPPVTVVMHEEPDPGAQRIEAVLRDRSMRVAYPKQSALLSLELRAALQRGELVAFQMDRPTTDGGLRVPFVDGEASFAAGPAHLARTCEVPVVPVFFPLDGNRLQILVESPLWAERTADREQDLLELTTRLADVYARVVRRHPEQWFNFFDFWSASPAR